MIVFGATYLRNKLLNDNSLGDISLTSSSTVRNLGVVFDLSLDSIIKKKISRCAFFLPHLHNIANPQYSVSK